MTRAGAEDENDSLSLSEVNPFASFDFFFRQWSQLWLDLHLAAPFKWKSASLAGFQAAPGFHQRGNLEGFVTKD